MVFLYRKKTRADLENVGLLWLKMAYKSVSENWLSFVSSGLQQTESLHCCPRPAEVHSRGFLENDLGTQRGNYRHDNQPCGERKGMSSRKQ